MPYKKGVPKWRQGQRGVGRALAHQTHCIGPKGSSAAALVVLQCSGHRVPVVLHLIHGPRHQQLLWKAHKNDFTTAPMLLIYTQPFSARHLLKPGSTIPISGCPGTNLYKTGRRPNPSQKRRELQIKQRVARGVNRLID
jgi:hypothetical protein